MAMTRVLFVDDEPSVLAGLQNVLRRQRRQWEMVFVENGAAALEAFREKPFDIVVSDMRMPGMDGAELLERVRASYPSVARIILSGHSEREALIRALPVAHQYLSKPCDAEVLRRVLERTAGLQELLQDAAVRSLVGRIDHLPSVPRTYHQLSRAIVRPDVGIAEVAAIVESDPAMSAKVLQLVNCGYFGLSQPVTCTAQAVTRLGIEMVRGLALSAQVFSSVPVPVLGSAWLEDLQQHSLVVGQLGRRLVGSAHQAEQVFTAAMMHDIGKVILAMGWPGEYQALCREIATSARPGYLMERERLGVSHSEVAAYLLGVWGLPLEVVEAVAYHHEPSRAKVIDCDVLVALHVADRASRQRTAGPADRPPHGIDAEFVERSGLAARCPDWREILRREGPPC